MRRVLVRYKVKADRVDENISLIQRVFEELRSKERADKLLGLLPQATLDRLVQGAFGDVTGTHPAAHL